MPFSTFLIVGSDLHHGGGSVGRGHGTAVGFADAGVAGEDVGPAVLAAEYCSFGEYRQTIQRGRTAGAGHRIGQNSVVEGDVDAVMVPVKGYRLHGGLIRLEKSSCWIEITVDVENLKMDAAVEPTNRNIKAYIEEKYGFKVHDQYIAQVRGKLGIKAHEGYNKTEVHTRKVTICPEYKEVAIMDALSYFDFI